MQTFLPYEDFVKSAGTLDRQRLGKQRVECLQILNTLCGKTEGFKNHPAVRMWRGHELMLQLYAIRICAEWTSWGFQDTVMEKIVNLTVPDNQTIPPWLGNEDFHRSHRANLVHKLPEHYIPLFGNLPAEPYVWPV